VLLFSYCGLVDLKTFALKMEAAGSSKTLAIGNMAPWHHNPSDHNTLYFHENLDLWLIQLLVVGLGPFTFMAVHIILQYFIQLKE
jgi:hypothetical protein